MSGIIMNPPAASLRAFRCTPQQWRALRDIGNAMKRAGISGDVTPLRAYAHQKRAAEVRRGIPFRLTLWEWWTIWDESGHWAERGTGRGYQMCRYGDEGAYEVGNVFIGPGAENLSAAAKKTKLPIGVARFAKGVTKPYRAYCNIGGKQRHLGLFETVWEAEAAYLRARDFDLALKSATQHREAA